MLIKQTKKDTKLGGANLNWSSNTKWSTLKTKYTNNIMWCLSSSGVWALPICHLGGRREARQGGPASCPPFLLPPRFFILGLPTCLAKAAISSLKESEEQTSPPGGEPSPAEAPSRGEHVASSHFSKTRAKSGKRGCLWGQESGHS